MRSFVRVSIFDDVLNASELGLSCIPLAIETYGCRGAEARLHLLRLASHLAPRLIIPNARALLSRAYPMSSDVDIQLSSHSCVCSFIVFAPYV